MENKLVYVFLWFALFLNCVNVKGQEVILKGENNSEELIQTCNTITMNPEVRLKRKQCGYTFLTFETCPKNIEKSQLYLSYFLPVRKDIEKKYKPIFGSFQKKKNELFCQKIETLKNSCKYACIIDFNTARSFAFFKIYQNIINQYPVLEDISNKKQLDCLLDYIDYIFYEFFKSSKYNIFDFYAKFYEENSISLDLFKIMTETVSESDKVAFNSFLNEAEEKTYLIPATMS